MERKYYKIENIFYKVIVSIETGLSEQNILSHYEYIIKSTNKMVADKKADGVNLFPMDFLSKIYADTFQSNYEEMVQEFLKYHLEKEINIFIK